MPGVAMPLRVGACAGEKEIALYLSFEHPIALAHTRQRVAAGMQVKYCASEFPEANGQSPLSLPQWIFAEADSGREQRGARWQCGSRN